MMSFQNRPTSRDGELTTRPQVDIKTQDIERRQAAFVAKYDIKVLGESQVSFTLPHGSSRIDLLNEAQEIAPKLIGRDAIYPPRLKAWQEHPAFTSRLGEGLERAVDGCVQHSNNQTNSEQLAQNLLDVSLPDLACAHAAFLIATKRNLFNGDNVVRTNDESAYGGYGRALYFSRGGLDQEGGAYGYRSSNTFACRDLSSEGASELVMPRV
jgi:hypothetical protein